MYLEEEQALGAVLDAVLLQGHVQLAGEALLCRLQTPTQRVQLREQAHAQHRDHWPWRGCLHHCHHLLLHLGGVCERPRQTEVLITSSPPQAKHKVAWIKSSANRLTCKCHTTLRSYCQNISILKYSYLCSYS